MPVTTQVIDAINLADAAHDLLESKLRKIDGVCITRRSVSRYGVPELEVKVDNRDASKAVYRAEMEVYEQFPDTHLNVELV